jgi:hypothetical protein
MVANSPDSNAVGDTQFDDFAYNKLDLDSHPKLDSILVPGGRELLEILQSTR